MGVPTRPLRIRAVAAVCALAGSTVLVTACGNDEPTRARPAAAPTSATPAAPRHTEDQDEREAPIPAAKAPWGEAAATSVAEVPQGGLTGIELKRAAAGASPSPGAPTPGAPPQWAAGIAPPDGTVRTLRVDTASGKVTDSRVGPGQDADDKREAADLLRGAKQTPQLAVGTATGGKNGTVSAVRLDEGDADKVIRSVDVVTPEDWDETTAEVDATTGTILREHVDRD
ncbi:hypothetical protein [Streptomyces sp. NPDC006368]|uniref:PepSY domain-containing protein n=1 Tax=Streptomyces sp. NPDC006368 TaxID=3156760 RepID=UPI0033AB47BC